MAGCTTIREGAKKFAGISTKVLEDGRKQSITQTFSHDYPTCYMQTQEILKQIGAYIYAKDVNKQMIAIYVSEEDTTPVGLFFNETGQTTTRIEVSSPSEYAKEQIATKVFSGLEKSLIAEK